jgi:hypothetical protein
MNSTLTIVGVAAIGTAARLPETFFEARNLIDRERLILVRVESSESITGVSTISHRDMQGIDAGEDHGEPARRLQPYDQTGSRITSGKPHFCCRLHATATLRPYVRTTR